jgi:hypothetical protein
MAVKQYLADHPLYSLEYSPANTQPLAEVTMGMGTAYIWVCSVCTYTWKSRIAHRITGTSNCAACEKKILSTANPELAAEWGTQNETTPADHKPGERTRVWWICLQGHPEYKAAIANRRLLSVGCPICKPVRKGKSVAEVAPQLVPDWSSKNTLTPKQVYAAANTPIIWECSDCAHEWTTRISHRVEGQGCPKCNGTLIADKSIAVMRPEWVTEWSDKNTKKANEVSFGSGYIATWNCPENHEYTMRPFERVAGSGCPTCRLAVGSIAAKYPKHAKEFDIERNGGKTAADIFAGSPSKIWWKCESRHSWKVAPSSRFAGQVPTQCPRCMKSNLSRIEEALRESFMADSIIEIDHEDISKHLPVAFNKRYQMSVDISGRFKDHLVVVEYDGWYWHSGTGRKGEGTFERDIAKTQALLDASYLVVRVREEQPKVCLAHLPIRHKNLLQLSFHHQRNGHETRELRQKNLLLVAIHLNLC